MWVAFVAVCASVAPTLFYAPVLAWREGGFLEFERLASSPHVLRQAPRCEWTIARS